MDEQLSSQDTEQLQQLLDKQTQTGLNRSEMDQLLKLSARPETREVLATWIDQHKEKLSEWPQGLDYQPEPERFRKMQTQIFAGEKPKRPLVHRIGRWQAAAAILLLLLGGYYWYRTINHTPAVQPPALAQDLAPGRSKATLILGNGREIHLDSAQNGSLAEDANGKIDKIRDGQLRYQPVEGEAPVAMNTLVVPKGGQYEVLLPDGTHVWLNAASTLRYPARFAKDKREVELTGEAYFEVAHQGRGGSRVPFLVHTRGQDNGSSQDIEVLGTHFNVSSYPDDPAMETSLFEGAIRLHHQQEAKILKVGQQGVINKQEQGITLQPADEAEILAWKNGEFVFRDADIRLIMRQVARWYDAEIKYAGAVTNHFGATIKRDVPVSQLLHLLELTNHVHFTIQGKTITVYPD